MRKIKAALAAALLIGCAFIGTESIEAQDVQVQGKSAATQSASSQTGKNTIDRNDQNSGKSVRSSKRTVRYSGKRSGRLEERKSEKNPDVAVGLISGRSEVVLSGMDSFTAYKNGRKWKSFKKGASVTAARKGRDIYLNGKSVGPSVILATGSEDPAFSVKGLKYRGMIKLIPSSWNNGITVVNILPLEDYVKGVVACESPSTWPSEALKAQAVAARTYALYHTESSEFKASGFDVADDTRSQVYEGYSGEDPVTNKDVDDTRGEIITYDGKPIDAVFSADAGGYTESALNMWGTEIPYLQSVPEENDQKPETKTIPLNMFIKKLKDNGIPVNGFRRIKLSRLDRGKPHKAADRYVSGRVKYVTIFGKFGSRRIKGTTIQNIFGLKTTMFDFAIKNKKVTITCYGYGHGVGMSQWGAETMAKNHGNTKGYYKKILEHYYPGTKIEKIY